MNECTASELKDLVNHGWQIIDVREPFEVAQISLDLNEKNIPLGELENYLAELNPDDKYILFCRSGGRSSQAYAMLKDHDFEHIKNARGGMIQYEQYLSLLEE